MVSSIMAEIGSGELIDKITILQIKSARIHDTDKLKNVTHELSVLNATRDRHLRGIGGLDALAGRLKTLNETLWDIEDDIRFCEEKKDFGPKFVALARSVYVTNDKRAAVKREINILTGATIIEEKSYAGFK